MHILIIILSYHLIYDINSLFDYHKNIMTESVDLEGLLRIPWNIEIKVTSQSTFSPSTSVSTFNNNGGANRGPSATSGMTRLDLFYFIFFSIFLFSNFFILVHFLMIYDCLTFCDFM